MNTNAVREQMIEQQVRAGDVLNERVLDAMRDIRREIFVPEQYRKAAYADAPVPIGQGQTMLPPMVHGRILQALAPLALGSVYGPDVFFGGIAVPEDLRTVNLHF